MELDIEKARKDAESLTKKKTGRPPRPDKEEIEDAIWQCHVAFPDMPMTKIAVVLSKQKTSRGNFILSSTGKPLPSSYIFEVLKSRKAVPDDAVMNFEISPQNNNLPKKNQTPFQEMADAMAAEKLLREIEDRAQVKLRTGLNEMQFVTQARRDREMRVPSDLYPAMMAQRSALMPKARAMTAEEVAVLYQMITTLMETNAALREHTEQTANLVKDLLGAFKALSSIGANIESFANLRQAPEEVEEDA